MSPEAVAAPAGAATLFAALGDATRLELVARLGDGRARSVTALAEGLDLTRQGVSKHLRVLERAGVVARTRIGRESRYALEPAGLEQAGSYLERVAAQWDDAAARLKAFVESD